jgi:hypothetical protein
MGTSCENGQRYLYNTTGSYLNKKMSPAGYNIGFDSKSRFVDVFSKGISLYN